MPRHGKAKTGEDQAHACDKQRTQRIAEQECGRHDADHGLQILHARRNPGRDVVENIEPENNPAPVTMTPRYAAAAIAVGVNATVSRASSAAVHGSNDNSPNRVLHAAMDTVPYRCVSSTLQT